MRGYRFFIIVGVVNRLREQLILCVNSITQKVYNRLRDNQPNGIFPPYTSNWNHTEYTLLKSSQLERKSKYVFVPARLSIVPIAHFETMVERNIKYTKRGIQYHNYQGEGDANEERKAKMRFRNKKNCAK